MGGTAASSITVSSATSLTATFPSKDAGTYSVLQPELATQLRDRKLQHLAPAPGQEPVDAIVSANIGCIQHLQSGTATPVKHWVEVVDEALAG